MKEIIIPFILLILLIIILCFIRNNNYIHESFANDDPYLYPIKGLTNICAKDNLYPSYQPKACYVDGVLNSYANCKCEDNRGNCKLCYPTIKKDSKNASVVYSAGDFS